MADTLIQGYTEAPAGMQKRMTGAKPTSRHTLAASAPYRIVGTTPSSWIWLPKRLSYWGNQNDGDCVTASEAFNKACSGIFISEAEVIRWATAHGVLNGAYLNEVLDWFTDDGFRQDGNVYNDGKKVSVDWTNAAVLRNALSKGPVKIGVAASQLQNAVGDSNGWFAMNFQSDNQTDHCVELAGFGTVSELAGWLNVTVPSGIDPSEDAYGLFTWNTVGVINVSSIKAITSEAWTRIPNSITVGTNPPTPDPVFTPGPAPTPIPVPTPIPPASLFSFNLTRDIAPHTRLTLSTPVAMTRGKYNVSHAIGEVEAVIEEVSGQYIDHGKAMAVNWLQVIAVIKMMVQKFGPAAVPLIEQWVATLPLSDSQKATIDAILQAALGGG